MQTLDYGKFLHYSDIESHLLYLKDKYPDMLKLNVLTVTEEGRKVYLAEISRNISSDTQKEKGGYYVQGAIHANECGGSAPPMHLIDTLLSENPDILDDVVFYVVPRVNPDGVEENLNTNAEHRSKSVRNERNKENVLIKKDLDGDGLILSMRWKDPLGNYKEVAPGVMVPRKPGDEGEFYSVCTEGIIENYNGTPLKPSMRSYDFNRTYPCDWQALSYTSEYPLRPVETRAVCEFLVTHPNIFAGLDFHNGYNGILRPCMKPDNEVNKEDLNLILKVGKLAAEITGFPLIQEMIYGSGLVPVARPGGANEFFYTNLGLSHYVIELGNGLNDLGIKTDEYFASGKSLDEYMKDIVEYQEAHGNHICHPYKPFNHPQLGMVEIGGVPRSGCYYMNPESFLAIVPKTTEFILKHAAMGPLIKADNIETKKLGNDILRIRAQIKNLGIMGTKVMKGTTSYQAEYPIHAYLECFKGAEILSRPNVYEFKKLDSMQSEYLEWFVKAPEGVEVNLIVDHPKAKTVKIKIN